MTFLLAANAQETVSLTSAKRDSLLSLSKDVIMKFGPDYYREYKEPEISYHLFPSTDKDMEEGFLHWADRFYYRITYPYDTTQEKLGQPFAAEVNIWADTFEPQSVMFGCSLGKVFVEEDWLSLNVEPVKYQEAVSPKFPPITVIIPDSLVGKPSEREAYSKKQRELIRSSPDYLPTNIDELLKRGWEKRNGEWVKPNPELPPHKRAQ